jgi:hypothetical protein
VAERLLRTIQIPPQLFMDDHNKPRVLVFGKPCNDIGILQTKLRYREGHETRRIGP